MIDAIIFSIREVAKTGIFDLPFTHIVKNMAEAGLAHGMLLHSRGVQNDLVDKDNEVVYNLTDDMVFTTLWKQDDRLVGAVLVSDKRIEFDIPVNSINDNDVEGYFKVGNRYDYS